MYTGKAKRVEADSSNSTIKGLKQKLYSVCSEYVILFTLLPWTFQVLTTHSLKRCHVVIPLLNCTCMTAGPALPIQHTVVNIVHFVATISV